jgi:hypothetical protein
MDGEWLAERFEADRTRLQAVTYRLLGSASECAVGLGPPGSTPESPRLSP